MPRMSHQAELEGYILDGMARALWVHAYMIWATEVEPPPAMGSSSWSEMAPDNAGTRKASAQAAQALADLIADQFDGNYPLAEAFLRAAKSAGRTPSGGTEADRAYVFGENLAVVCLGAMDPADSVPPLGDDFVAPSFKVELDDEGRELSWEGGSDHEPTPNPARRMPTVREIAQAMAYIEREFQPDRRGISGERWAEGLAFGEHASVDKSHEVEAQHMLPQFDTATWLEIAAHADELRGRDGFPPRFSGAAPRGRVNPFTRNPAKAHALVLEDDASIARSLVRWVKKLLGSDVEVLVADNVDAAIAHLSAHDLKLIVSDVDVVGDKNGIDLFRYVQANRPELVDRYIFFTGGHPEVAQIHDRYVPKGDSTFEDFKAVYHKAAPRTKPSSVPPSTIHAPFDLKRFAGDVTAELPYIVAEPTAEGKARGRFGDRKVFIAALWRQLSTHPGYRDMTFDQFKHHLLDAVPGRLLVLARADLVAAMDDDEVRASETSRPGGIPAYHFVIDE